jgi:caa(3)-type oxidase subunit IV
MGPARRLSGTGEPIASVGNYLLTTIVLILLTLVNIGLSFVPLHGFNSALALLIATVEVLIMALNLMHLRWSPPMTRLVGVAGLLWLAILMVGTLDDVLTRGWLPVPGK